MSEVAIAILLTLLTILGYGSGLLLWPIRRWFRRKQAVRGRVLGFVFIAQLVAYAAVACCSIFIRLGHSYYWFFYLIGLNVLFSLAGAFAWLRDAVYERSLEVKQESS